MNSSAAKRFEEQIWLQRWMCYYCEKPMALPIDDSGHKTVDQATRDHYIASSRGGKRIVAACARCNFLKEDRGPERFTRIVRTLLENPTIDEMWHKEIEGLNSVLLRIIRIERWKEEQKKKPNYFRQRRIDDNVRVVLKFIKDLKS